MLELTGISPFITILLVFSISAVVSWGITQAVRSALISHHGKPWFNTTVRISAIVTGGIMGFVLLSSVVGLGLGLGGGALNTTVVAAVKSKIKNIKLSEHDASAGPGDDV